MNNNEYQKIGLYNHNIESYKKIKSAFDDGQNVVGIVHATGTGKSYNALELAYDNKDKKIVYVVPSNGIIEHIKKIIHDNKNLDLERDFPNLEFRTYQSFVLLNRKEIKNINCDLLILDEFHHIGAPIWGQRINTLIETHPEMKIFGMTAYTVRDRGTIYERDMANPETDELFSNKIESRYDLCDAMIDGILPKPIYKSAYINLINVENKLEERVQKLDRKSHEYKELMSLLSDIKKRIHEAPSISDILRKNIKPDGKYIYFCPPMSEEKTNDIETIKSEALKWFKEFVKEEDIIFYTSTSYMGKEGKKNREAFYDDVDLDGKTVENKLRVMFAINQYNEGVHAPNIDGVIMGRGTTSDIVYFEQLGRALSVRGNTKEKFDELEKYSINELIEMCKSKDILVKENESKEDLIEKLIAPIVIDLTNNFDYIKELENNLKDRIKELQSKGLGNKRNIKLKDASFDIEIENQDLFEILRYVSDRLTMTWEDYYYVAKKYYEHHGNLLIPINFKTIDGYTYEENGTIKLGIWISNQRKNFSKLSPERQKLLKSIDLVLSVHDNKWGKNYKLAKEYYEHHGNLLVPFNFKTTNGYTYDENGVNLGIWINHQRKNFSQLSSERQKLLKSIDLVLSVHDNKWGKNYKLAKEYYEHHGNLLVPFNFKTTNGYTYDENGVNLGIWINTQRKRFSNLSSERQELLKSIGFVSNVFDDIWENNYNFAKKYYEHHGNSLIPYNFRTNDGYTYDENGKIKLGIWICYQRSNFLELSPDKQELLKSIGFVFNVPDNQWENNYKLARKYYEHYGNLLVSQAFKTIDGYTYDENGINLGSWINTQRQRFSSLSPDKQELLKSMGFVSNVPENQWKNNYELAKEYYEYHGNLLIKSNFKTTNGYTYDENGVKLGIWINTQRKKFSSLSPDKQELLKSIGFVSNVYDDIWENNYELAKKYFEHYGNLLVPYNFKTTNGYTYDENGVKLGIWINNQRRNFLKLSQEKQELLKSIGFVFNVAENQWENNYSLAKKYFEHHGNLLIPYNFKTTNGYTYDENGVKLGIWINNQRRNFLKLSQEKQELLKSIGFVLSFRKNQEEIVNTCLTYNIDYNKNRSILKRISKQELISKIEFLKASNISFVDKNGVLINIFSMSSVDFKEKYNVTIEEIINEYYIDNQKGKGV